MVDAARAEGRFLMDALWSRFLPSWQRVKQLVDDGAIGDVRVASAELGFATDEGPDGRLLSHAAGGGSLLDSGIYPHAFVSWFLGAPTRIDAQADLGPTGVDEQTVCTLGYASGAHAQVRSSFRAALASAAFLAGALGSIEVAPRLHRSTRLVLRRAGHVDVVEDLPYDGPGLHLQAGARGALHRRGPHREPGHAARRDGRDPPHARHDPRADRPLVRRRRPARRHLTTHSPNIGHLRTSRVRR